MKVILYMATSVNGYISKLNHVTPWSDEEYESYASKVREVGNLIVGKTTYDLMLEEDDFAGLGNPFVVVLTSSQETPTRDNTVFVDSFDEALEELKSEKFKLALVGGGGQVDTAALDSGKLDEIFIDIESHVFGKGIPLFVDSDIDLELELLESTPIGNSGIQLHYKVKK